MKSSTDPRHQIRRQAIKELFAESFTSQKLQSPLTKEVIKKLKTIDKEIKEAAPTWPVLKLNKIDLAILRLAIFEFREKKTPLKVIIDEAIELAKEFGSENSSGFVNGVLGTIYKNYEDKKS